MRRLGTLIAVATLLAAGCTDAPTKNGPTVVAPATTTQAPPAVASSQAPAPSTGIVLPDVLDFDTGALEVTPQPTTEEGFVTLLEDLPNEEPGDPGVVLDLTECHLLAPGRWKVSGTIEAPEDAIGAEIGLYIGFSESNYLTPVRATIRASGDFAIPLDFVAASSIEGARTRSDLRETCNFQVAGATTPVDTFSGSAPTRYETSLSYEAPPGSLQSLGIGADLGDPRNAPRSWAYATFYDTDIPFEEIWLPNGEIPVLHSASIWSGLCRSISSTVQSGAILVTQTRDCNDPPAGEPTRVDGWLEEGSEPPSIFMPTDGGSVQLRAFGYDRMPSLAEDPPNGGLAVYPFLPETNVTVDDLLDVATTMTTFSNPAYRVPETGDPDLDDATATALETDGWAEAGRRQLGDLWLVAARGRDQRDPGKIVWHRTAVFEMILTSDGLWTVAQQPRARGSGATTCLIVKKLPRRSGQQVVASDQRILAAIFAEPDWTLQAMADGAWQDLETFGSAYLEIVDKAETIPTFRALDADGKVVRCSNESAPLGDGEAWSDFRSPDQGGISLEALPTDAEAGSVLSVSGSGAYAKKDVEISVCGSTTIGWVDRRDCDPTRTIRANVDLQGRFEAAVPIPSSFTTALGDTFDCRLDECVIRADTVRGIHRSGWVPFTIREGE